MIETKLFIVLCISLFCLDNVKGQCHPDCGSPVGTCLPSGRCLCFWGWTGPNATYTTKDNKIEADHCKIACHYTHHVRNKTCLNQILLVKTTTSTPTVIVPTPNSRCHPDCGSLVGTCLPSGRCLCFWGWTGPNAMYTTKDNKIEADHCKIACHYTHHVRNKTCLNQILLVKTTTSTPTESVMQVTTPNSKKKCHPQCAAAGVNPTAGTCQPSGKCLCLLGWTGPNAKYTTNKRILADYCNTQCHYTNDKADPECLKHDHPDHECKIPSHSKPKRPCDARCVANHGKCLRNGRCLCWWGWTGLHACYLDHGFFNNRILADYCEKQCHYTHDVRNATCLDDKWIQTN